MCTLNPMSLFDICPDLEELIVDELKVLTKYRDAVKEFKTRMVLGRKALNINIKDHNSNTAFYRRPKLYYGMPRNIIHTLFPKYGKQNNTYGSYYKSSPMRISEIVNIHGFLFNGRYDAYEKWESSYSRPNHYEMTVENLNKVLTELGAKRFKSKKKADKIKLLMKY